MKTGQNINRINLLLGLFLIILAANFSYAERPSKVGNKQTGGQRGQNQKSNINTEQFKKGSSDANKGGMLKNRNKNTGTNKAGKSDKKINQNTLAEKKENLRNSSSAKKASEICANREVKMSEVQKQNLETLKSDLKSMKEGSLVTQEQKDKLTKDLQQMISGANKPSQESVQTLTNDLSSVMADSSLTIKEQVQIAKDVEVVLNSANISQEELNAVVTDAQEILTAGGVSKEDAQKIADDLHAIGAEIQKNAAAVK